MTLRTILFLVFLLPTAAWSATVTVKSGDHEGFTRLVFYYPSQGKPTIEEKGNFLHVIFHGTEVNFDLSDAFSLISRDRVQGLEPLGNMLQINLACDCQFSLVTISSGISYVDISQPSLFTETAKEPTAQINRTPTTIKSAYTPILKEGNFPGGLGGVLRTISAGNETQLSELVPELTKTLKSRTTDEDFFLNFKNSIPLSNLSPERSSAHAYNENTDQGSGENKNPGALTYITSRDNGTFKTGSAENTCAQVEHHDALDFDLPNSNFSEIVGETRVLLMSTGFTLQSSELNRIVKFYLAQTMFSEARFYLSLMGAGPRKDILDFAVSVSTGDTDVSDKLPADLPCVDYGNFWIFLAGLSDDFSRQELGEFLVYFRSLPERLSGVLLSAFLERLQKYSFPDGELFVEDHKSLLPQDIATGPSDILEKELSSTRELLEVGSDTGGFELSSSDRLLLEGSAHVLSTSAEGIEVRKKLLMLHLHQTNWVAGIGVIEELISDGLLEIAAQLLNDALIPSLIENASPADLALISSHPSFTSVMPLVANVNLSLLEEKVEHATREFAGTPRKSNGAAEGSEIHEPIAEEVPSAVKEDDSSGMEQHLSHLSELLDKSYQVRNSVGEFLETSAGEF